MSALKGSRYSNLLRNNLVNVDACEERKILLNDESDEDEEAIFNVPSSQSLGETAPVHGKLEGIKVEVRKVTEAMLDNVQKVTERGQRLEDLELASDRLIIAGTEFENSARKARRNGWLQNLTSKYATATVMFSIFVIVLVTTIVKYS